MIVSVIGAVFGVGASLLVWQFVPGTEARRRRSMLDQRRDEVSIRHRIESAIAVSKRFQSLEPDLAIMQIPRQQMMGLMARSAILGALLFAVLAAVFLNGPLVVVAGALVGGVVGVLSEARQLTVKARDRREQFDAVTQGMFALTTVGLQTSRPIAQIATEVIDSVSGWAGELLHEAAWNGQVDNLSIGRSLERLGKQIRSASIQLYGETVHRGESQLIGMVALQKRAEKLQIQTEENLRKIAGRQRERTIVPIIGFALAIMALSMLIPMAAALRP